MRNIIITESQYKLLISEQLSSKVYHFTSIRAAYDIIHNNEMFCQSALAGGGADDRNKKYKFYVSLSRTKSTKIGFGSNGNGRPRARIELDGDLLNQNFKGQAVNYWGAHDLLNKYTYMRHASGMRDDYVYMEVNEDDVPRDAVIVKKDKWVSYPTKNSPDYIKVGNTIFRKQHNKENTNPQIAWAYKETNGIPEDKLNVISDWDFKYPLTSSPLYVKHEGKTFKKERAIPNELAKHVDNEIEDRLFTDKSVIDNIRKYIKRVDIFIGDFNELEEGTKRLVYNMSLIRHVFLYDNIEDFDRQSENDITEQIKTMEDAYSLYGRTFAERESNASDIKNLLVKFFDLLTIGMSGQKEKYGYVANTLKKYGFDSYINDTIRDINRGVWGNFSSIASDCSSYVQNISKSPSKKGQQVLYMVSDILSKKGVRNWKELVNLLDDKYNTNKSKWDYIDEKNPRDITVLTINYRNFDITNDEDTNIWQILNLQTKQDRYWFVEDLIDKINYSTNGNWERDGEWINNIRNRDKNKFLKYLQNLTYQKVTIKQFDNLLKKLGYSFNQLAEDKGWEYQIEVKPLTYWDYTNSNIISPQLGNGTDDIWDCRDRYAEEVLYRKKES